jgi:hypothetical protein
VHISGKIHATEVIFDAKAGKILFLRAMRYTIILLAGLLFAACNADKKEKDYSKLPAGTLIAADSMSIAEDSLNQSQFSVKVTTTAKTAEGKYGVQANWGYNPAETQFTLPKGGETFIPVLRKGQQPYTYIIGFNIPDDTTFYDYFQVQGNQGGIRMQYIKTYSFE